MVRLNDFSDAKNLTLILFGSVSQKVYIDFCSAAGKVGKVLWNIEKWDCSKSIFDNFEYFLLLQKLSELITLQNLKYFWEKIFHLPFSYQRLCFTFIELITFETWAVTIWATSGQAFLKAYEMRNRQNGKT